MSCSQKPRVASCTRHCLTAALALCYAMSSASGQLGARRALIANPPRSVVLGTPVVLSVRGAASGARYRYVATMTNSGAARATGTRCSQTQSIGSGASVTWSPASGTYRLTAYGPTGRLETDTLSLTYVVLPRTVMLATSQTPVSGDSVSLVLRTDDLGPGHVYEWWMQYRGQPFPTGGGTYGLPPLSPPWTAQTNGPMATYPKPIRPPSSVTATVAIHRGDPCAVVAVGTMPPGA
jgi:hypothetical protein